VKRESIEQGILNNPPRASLSGSEASKLSNGRNYAYKKLKKMHGAVGLGSRAYVRKCD
jgi:hypothetical protein